MFGKYSSPLLPIILALETKILISICFQSGVEEEDVLRKELKKSLDANRELKAVNERVAQQYQETLSQVHVSNVVTCTYYDKTILKGKYQLTSFSRRTAVAPSLEKYVLFVM